MSSESEVQMPARPVSEVHESPAVRIAIQGELGSNSHKAALNVISAQGGVLFSQLAPAKTSGAEGMGVPAFLPCSVSAEVFERLEDGTAAMAVLPIENSLYGSVFEHYDLLLESRVSVVGETLLRVRHNVIAAPGVKLQEIRKVMSHTVALSQCRKWLREHPEIEVVPFYDTAGSVKELMRARLRDCAGLAPELAAREYGAQVIVSGVEDHRENYTRFYVLAPETEKGTRWSNDANKASVAFSLEHRPGSLIEALELFRRAGLNLTKIESRPVPGRPWEYIFFVDVRFEDPLKLEEALAELRTSCEMVKELGRYRAAMLDSW